VRKHSFSLSVFYFTSDHSQKYMKKLHSAVRFLAGAGFAAAAVLSMSAPAFAADTLYRSLSIGMQGADVSALQTFLAQDNTIYPQGLVTGYFGSLTSAAVSKFQARNGIDVVGVVGPITLAALNAQMDAGTTVSTTTPVLFGITAAVNSNSSTISWNTDQLTMGRVYYSTSPLAIVDHETTADVSGVVAMSDTSFHTSSQKVTLTGLASNTTYFYVVYTTSQSGVVTMSTPAVFHTMN
jgi:peptidoglycan hydrolase-like protein with peptidoglycan-binding domain